MEYPPILVVEATCTKASSRFYMLFCAYGSRIAKIMFLIRLGHGLYMNQWIMTNRDVIEGKEGRFHETRADYSERSIRKSLCLLRKGQME